MRADLDEIFETGAILIEALGHPIFRPLIEKAAPDSSGDSLEEWFLSGPEASARGSYSAEGFVVREGSYCRLAVVDSAKDSFVTGGRARLLANGILVEEGGHLVFKEDY